MESINVVIDNAINKVEGWLNWGEMENLSDDPITSSKPKEQPILDALPSSKGLDTPEKEKSPSDNSKLPREPSSRVKSNHPKDNIVADLEEGMRPRKKVLNNLTCTNYVSQIEPKKVKETLKDECWVNAMPEELNQFARNNMSS